jgi:RNA polymerase sigma-70 factor (ECF subfamily)
LEEIRINTWQTKKGFEVLFKQYYEPLCAFVYGILKDYNASEEVVQDLFVKMWIKRKSILTDTSIKAYLYRAARNLALNQLKHHIIKEQYKQYNKKELDNAGHNSGNLTEENELNGMVIRAIDKLPAKRKKIFLMSRNDGLKYKEIAEKLNISIKTVENQMGKALSTLRTELAEYLPAVIIAIILGMKSG